MVYSEIKEIFNLSPIISALKNADKNTLIIFDVDEVLIMPTPEHDFRDPYRIKILENISKQLTNNQIDFFKSIIFAQRKVKLIDPDLNKLFDLIVSMNMPSLALTAMGTGKFGIINNMVEFRIKELSKFNISFKLLTPLNGEYIANVLNNVTKIFPDIYGVPCLNSGIIFTAGMDKGIVLAYILQKYNYYPKNIIFVDDYLPNLESLKQLCIKLGINFYGFHYKAASLVPLPKINEKLEIIRFQRLLQERLWLNYYDINLSNKKIKSLRR
jgi:hypothetical protein